MTLGQPQQAQVATAEPRAPSHPTSQPIVRLIATHRVPLAAFLVHLALTLAVTGAAMAWFGKRPPVPAVGYTLRPMTGLAHYLLQPLRNWDGFWYTLIAERGYEAHPATSAFWPLYPLVLNIIQTFTGWSIPIAGIVLSNAAFLVALALLFRLVALDYGRPVARRAVWLMALAPTAYYFSAVYTESLFLLLTVAAVYFARTDRWGYAAVAAGLAGLTRNTGVLILLPVGFLLLQRVGWHPRDWWRPALPLAVAGLSPLLFLWHLDQVWGDPLATLHAQQDWARYRAMPWETVAEAVRQFDVRWLRVLRMSPSWDTLTSPFVRFNFSESEAYDLVAFAVTLPIALYTLVRVRLGYALYALLAFSLPLFTPSEVHPLMSIPRFVVVLFPLFIGLGLLLRNRWLLGAWLALSVVQYAVLLIQFSTWHWVA